MEIDVRALSCPAPVIMNYFCYITFPTTYHAIRADKVLSSGNISFKMVPVPRSISSSCGTSVKLSCNDIETVKQILISADVESEKIYRLEENEKSFSLKNLFKKDNNEI